MRERVEQYKDIHSGQEGSGVQKIASLTDKYAHLVKNKGKDPNDQFGGANQNNELIFAEMERLKESESDAR